MHRYLRNHSHLEGSFSALRIFLLHQSKAKASGSYRRHLDILGIDSNPISPFGGFHLSMFLHQSTEVVCSPRRGLRMCL